ncbi:MULTISPECIES: DUF349 domain-containing protein [Butyricimonas]|uniref:DUF349 domain-containing protein n=1 Tax=Butyricimonas TaxID=574697 RepID=UPI0003627C15|nr:MULTISPECIES: DUF349 domain-containing protein [Butyricimonas]
MEQENLQQAEELQNNEPLTSDTLNDETQNEVSVQGQPTPIEKTPEKEIPVWDFSSFNTDEIISHMKALLDDFPVQRLKVLDNLPQVFEAQHQKEYDKALAEYTKDGSPAETFDYQDNSKERFYSVYRIYREKKTEFYKKLEGEKEQNLKDKLQIIEELKDLIQHEESLNKTYQDFKNLQERWRNIGMVPQAQASNLLETYHHHVENFFNYVKINKELRDLDLKKNLDAKNALIEQATALLEDNNVGNAFRQLQSLHAQWKEIGPVAKEHQEEAWNRFKEVTDKINEAYHKFFDTLREEQENNLKLKEEICRKLEEYAVLNIEKATDWNTASDGVLALQEEWKHAGTIPIKERNRLYKRYRAACDAFFNKKRQFFQEIQSMQSQNLAKKIALCEKVEAIKESTEWRTTTSKIIEYQREWKTIGPIPKKISNKIWNRFRSACDYFFDRKSELMKNVNSDQEKNLELKRALIEETRNFQLTGNTDEDIETLKAFQARWAEIGFVPIKEKDAIQTEFRKLINTHFDQLDIDEFDKNIERFKSKINTFDNSDDKASRIIQEREKLVNKIKQLEADLHAWENNIGFFSKSNKSEGLIKEFTVKIENARHKLSLMQEKLKLIDSMI